MRMGLRVARVLAEERGPLRRELHGSTNFRATRRARERCDFRRAESIGRLRRIAAPCPRGFYART